MVKIFFSGRGLPFSDWCINAVSKAIKMKKIFLLSFLATSLVACNSEGGSTTDVKDSIIEKIDSTGDARVDSIQEATDSLQNRTERNFESTDSANKVLIDSMNKK